jgi:hypothetical protein
MIIRPIKEIISYVFEQEELSHIPSAKTAIMEPILIKTILFNVFI